MKSLSHVRLFATPWTLAHQAPPSMGFSRQEYWSGLPFSSPGDLPDPGIEPRSPTLWAGALPSEPPGELYSWSKECRDRRSCYRVHTHRERLPVGLLYRVLGDEGYFSWAEHSSAVHSVPDHSARCSIPAHSTHCHLG